MDEAQSQTVTFTVTPATAADAALAAQIFVADGNGDPDVTVDSQGTLRFQTLPDANGDVTFTIVADDNSGLPLSTSPVKTFTISVRPVNDPPTFTPGASTVSHDEDSGTYSDVWATDISAGPFEENTGVQTVRFDVSIDPADAALFQTAPTIDDSGVLRFVPAPDANGTATVTVRAIDSAGGISDPVLFDIIINPVVDTPTAVDDVFEVDEDTVRTLLRQELLDNDIDPDLPDDVLTISLVSTVTRSGASVTLDSDNNVVYDPTQSSVLQSLAPGETATDTFSYVLIDSFGRVSQPAVVSMIVSGVNDAPQLLPDNPDVQPTGSTILRPLDNDSDIDGTLDVSTLEITLDPAFGSVTLPGDGTIIYTPYAGFRGTDTLRYTVKDNLGAAGPETLISIRANAAPVAADDRGGTFQNEAVDIDVLANDSDPDGDDTLNPDSIVIVRQPTSGTAFALGGGLVRYVPAEGFNGNDSFTYTVSDNLGRPSEPATVRVQVVSSRAQNPLNNMDVSGDGEISPIDALLTVNLLNRLGPVNINNAGVWQPDETYALGDIVQVGDQSWLAEGTPTVGQQPGPGTVWGEVGKPFYDVDGNRRIEPLVVLTVVNELNRRARQGQGSGQGEAVAGLERRSEEETQVALDLAHTLPPAPRGKLVSTDAAVVEAV
ncbi:MAG: Ig-like domain-containing protein, partial [Maioricimonas sp. JB049]